MLQLEDIQAYEDIRAKNSGEPGIVHSFMKALATAVFYLYGSLLPEIRMQRRLRSSGRL